jgi:hypothetical protein
LLAEFRGAGLSLTAQHMALDGKRVLKDERVYLVKSEGMRLTRGGKVSCNGAGLTSGLLSRRDLRL